MKKLFMTFALVSLSMFSQAQGNNGTNSNWKLNGNSISTGQYLGTSNSEDLVFKTNNTEGFRLDVNGNLIIGGLINGVPAERFTLNGNMVATGSLIADGISVANFVRSDKGVLLKNVFCFEGNDGTPGSANRMWTMNGDMYIQSHDSYGYNTILNKGNTGNVGIGSSSPQEKLDVDGNVILRNRLILPNLDPTTGGDNIVFIDGNGDLKMGGGDDIIASIYEDKICPSGDILSPVWANGLNKIFVKCPQVFVGIGTDTPLHKLDVRGNVYSSGAVGIGVEPALSDAQFILKTQQNREVGVCVDQDVYEPFSYAFKAIVHDEETKGFGIYSELYSADVFAFYSNGKMEVSNASGKIMQLEADGLLRARRVKVDVFNWPDYVFDESYLLQPLSEVKEFIDANGHLPNVPSATVVEEEGSDLGEMNKVLLRKIEEMTLYMIEQDQRIQELEKKLK